MASTDDLAAGRYLDPLTLDKIKRLDVRARVVVEGFMTGSHRSPYHGFAVEFAAHREYAPGDDLRHIDWKVWSKTDRLYIKEFEEETNLKCHLIVDRSKSMEYGSANGWSKYDYGATAAASLAYLMQQQQDSVGLTLFSNQIDRNLKPSTHPSHLKMVFHELEQAKCDQKTEVADAFLALAAQFRQRGMVVLISDLLLPLKDLEESLKQFRLRRHEVIVLNVMHHDEIAFPFDENTLFKGLETDVQLLTEPRHLKRAYLEALEKHLAEVKRICAGLGIDYLLLDTSKRLDVALTSYLNFRLKSRRRLTGRF
ncbi:MAG: DUF58 domain-containing protein [Pirellulaceae bacterium]|jgi:uncharacterized protein (DUF58 family)|nr:DUF58 domain-containing protein [Pirellulaceae bacterium]